MPDPHARAIAAAERTTRELAILFGKLGTLEHPRGAVLSAYRQARRALKGKVGTPEMEAILMDLQIAVLAALATVYYQAQDLGNEQAARELAAYDIFYSPALMGPEIGDAINATGGVLETQIKAARLIEDEALLIGDDQRDGLLTHIPVFRSATYFAAMLAAITTGRAINGSLRQAGVQDQYMRQAISAIDERTTDCCLRVHGQTIPLDGKFKLTGTPRYADEMKDRPFHDHCRTAVALVPAKEKDDDLTREMRSAAQAELKAREAAQVHIDDLKKKLADLGETPDIRRRKADTPQVKSLRNQLRSWKAKQRVEIHPAHATSRR